MPLTVSTLDRKVHLLGSWISKDSLEQLNLLEALSFGKSIFSKSTADRFVPSGSFFKLSQDLTLTPATSHWHIPRTTPIYLSTEDTIIRKIACEKQKTNSPTPMSIKMDLAVSKFVILKHQGAGVTIPTPSAGIEKSLTVLPLRSFASNPTIANLNRRRAVLHADFGAHMPPALALRELSSLDDYMASPPRGQWGELITRQRSIAASQTARSIRRRGPKGAGAGAGAGPSAPEQHQTKFGVTPDDWVWDKAFKVGDTWSETRALGQFERGADAGDARDREANAQAELLRGMCPELRVLADHGIKRTRAKVREARARVAEASAMLTAGAEGLSRGHGGGVSTANLAAVVGELRSLLGKVEERIGEWHRDAEEQGVVEMERETWARECEMVRRVARSKACSPKNIRDKFLIGGIIERKTWDLLEAEVLEDSPASVHLEAKEIEDTDADSAIDISP